MNKLYEYLSKLVDMPVQPVPVEIKVLAGLPLYLKGLYRFEGGLVFNKPVVWAYLQENNQFTAAQLQKHSEALMEYFPGHPLVVFVINHLASWQRERLIEKRIPFVEPGKQVYIPQLILQLDYLRREGKRETPKPQLTPPAQCVLLYHLIVQPLAGTSFQELADRLQYSPMTITRVVKELIVQHLVQVKKGRPSYLQFTDQGHDLWHKARPLLSSPIRDVWFLDNYLPNALIYQSGDNALSAYTMLAESRQQSWAIGKDAFRQLKQSNSLPPLSKTEGLIRLEVWHYNPGLLTKDGKVDPLSLYLSIPSSNDERVHAAHEELINNFKWSKG